MRSPTRTDLGVLLEGRQPPCISIYLATDRSYPGEQQGPTRYKNAVAAAEDLLRKQYSGHEVNGLLDKFRALVGDQFFWGHRLDGLAVFGARDLFEIFDLQTKPKEATVVADSFHLKPLLHYTQSADRFQVLCLQREKCWMLEGNRYALDEIDLRGVPGTISEALGEEIVEGRELVAAHGKNTGGTHHAPGKPTVPHGHAAEGSDADRDTRRFFQAIDKEVWERHSRPSNLPLVLAALPQYQSQFRELSKNQHLVRDGIVGNPAALSRGELVSAAWEAVKPFYLDRLNKFVNDFNVARSRGMGSDELEDVARGAPGGRVGILLVDADQQISGRLDRNTGAVQRSEPADAPVDDLLDDLAELVLMRKGQVVVVPHEQMPTQTGLAAVYRF